MAHDAEVRSLAIGKKSSRMFITGGNDRKVNLWAIGKQTPLLVFVPYVNDTTVLLAILKFESLNGCLIICTELVRPHRLGGVCAV